MIVNLGTVETNSLVELNDGNVGIVVGTGELPYVKFHDGPDGTLSYFSETNVRVVAKPCPICGGPVRIYRYDNEIAVVACENFDCSTRPVAGGRGVDQACENWNRGHRFA